MKVKPAQAVTLSVSQTADIVSLLAIGCRSGDVVLGLSSVRRVAHLACIFVSRTLSAGTVRQLLLLAHQGTVIYELEDIELIRVRVGRPDIMVLGIKSGSLAAGVTKKLEKESNNC